MRHQPSRRDPWRRSRHRQQHQRQPPWQLPGRPLGCRWSRTGLRALLARARTSGQAEAGQAAPVRAEAVLAECCPQTALAKAEPVPAERRLQAESVQADRSGQTALARAEPVPAECCPQAESVQADRSGRMHPADRTWQYRSAQQPAQQKAPSVRPSRRRPGWTHRRQPGRLTRRVCLRAMRTQRNSHWRLGHRLETRRQNLRPTPAMAPPRGCPPRPPPHCSLTRGYPQSRGPDSLRSEPQLRPHG